MKRSSTSYAKYLIAGALAALAVPALIIAAPDNPTPDRFTAALAPQGRQQKALTLDPARKPAEVLKFLGVKPGDSVLDFWGASGYYTQILARIVGPDGRAVSFEPAQYYDAKTQAYWAEFKKSEPNIDVFSLPIQDFNAPPASYDFVLFHLIYHDLYWSSASAQYPRMDPVVILKRLYTAVKPGGIVGVVDHMGPIGDPRTTVEKLHRISAKRVKADFAAAGFVYEAESTLLHTPGDDLTKSVYDPSVQGKTDRFILRFRKPG